MHYRIIEYIRENYKHILSGNTEESLRLSELMESGLMDFGERTWIFEVAESGYYGGVKGVEKLGLYDFFEALEYIRSKNKYYELKNDK